jgi:hypothetical protein
VRCKSTWCVRDSQRLYFFPSTGSTVPPSEVLYKRAVVLAPGFFSHTDAAHSQVHLQLLASAIQELQQELGETSSATAGFCCLTVAPFMPNEPAPEVPDLLRRIDALLASGGNVLLFRQPELYHMTASRKPAYEGACAFRCGPFPDDSGV